MATIRERRRGVWEVRAFTGRDATGRPTQVSRTVRGAKRDAERVAAELTLRPATAAAKTTVGELLDLWIDQQRGAWAPSTARDQQSRVGLVKADPISRIPLVRLTAVDVDRWHARLARAGAGEGSIRNQHLVLRAAVTQALRWGWVTTNVVAVARLGRRKQAPRGALGDDEVRLVLGAAEELVATGEVEPVAAVALRLAAATGARRSELAALRWKDLDDGRLTVDSSLAIIRHGSPGARVTPTLRDDPTKTGNRRTVTLDKATEGMLVELRRSQGACGPWILAVGERPVNPERITAWWRRARDRAGLDQRWRLHDLRHWSATTSIANGHDIRTVANRLGHANPAMTLRVYAHAVESADGAVADMIGHVLDGEG
ncbi:MAG TPA: site-specific integrase [Acidimicrobiales bacterium]|nr:site-specific integrase [Acidimicrobiales bacterium]